LIWLRPFPQTFFLDTVVWSPFFLTFAPVSPETSSFFRVDLFFSDFDLSTSPFVAPLLVFPQPARYTPFYPWRRSGSWLKKSPPFLSFFLICFFFPFLLGPFPPFAFPAFNADRGTQI